MSLAVALEGADGVVLAADSRGTIGDPRGLTAIQDAHEKLFQLTKWAGICIFGSAEIGVELVRCITGTIHSGHGPDGRINLIEDQVRDAARERYANWFSSFKVQDRPPLGLLLSGIQENGKPRTIVYSHQLDFAPQVAATGMMMGGIPQYAIYLCHRFYDASQTVEKLANLAEYLIAETATQDQKVGGPIKIARISKENGYIALKQEEVAEIHKRNEEQSRLLREHFYKGG
jgi:20S proteasome alpha/beta subunit